MAPDAVGHLEGGRTVTGPGEFQDFHSTMFAAIPDMRFEIVDTLAENDDVCVRWEATGTHTGNMFDRPASGARVSVHGVTWLRVADGRIVEGWDSWNYDGLVRQMSTTAAE
jgi:steroid delta-isomerase-like uncharacterized protein